MIPQKLELTNFLSYRETAVIGFENFHLACISGLNGAGKSSILDGITWALFGRSRSKSDDDLINRLAVVEGKTAEVRFTFTLEGSAYRVIRRKGMRKAMALELQIATGPEQWKTLSESKLRDTQAAIENLLRMNYDTFTNASFLLQGKADEFTTKTPNRRKEILADLLGMSQWDRYKEAATERRKLEEGRWQLLEAQVADIEQELAEEAERKAALAEAQAHYATVLERLNLKEQLLGQMRQTEKAVQQQKETVKNLANNLARAQRSLTDLQQMQAQRQKERDSHQAILDEADRITADFTAWKAADATVQTWQTKADAHNQLQQAKRPHELAVTQAKTRLEQRQKELENQARQVASATEERETVVQALAKAQARLEQLTADLAALVEQEKAWHEARTELQRLEGERKLLAQEVSQLQAQARRIQTFVKEKAAVLQNIQEAQTLLTDLNARSAALTAQRQQHATSLADMNNLQSEQPRLREQMLKFKERVDRLESETGGECPLCGQALSETHRQAVLTELRAEGKEMGDRYRANKERLEKLAVEVEQLEKTLQQSPQLEKEQQVQQQRLAKAEARLAEIEQAAAEWESGDAARLAELEKALADDSAVAAQKARVLELGTAVQAKTRLEQERTAQQQQASTAEARLAQIDQLAAAWEQEGQAALTAVKQQLTDGTYAPEAQTALAELDKQLAELGYDAAAHHAARQELALLAAAPARHQSLKEAEAAVKPLDDTLAHLAEQVAGQSQIVADLAQQHETAVATLESLTADGDAIANMHTIEDEVFSLREEQSNANRRVGAAEQRLKVLDDLRVRREQLTAEQASVRQLIQRLKLLEKACGRDGVQALLIEQALPDIEERANELLERLTGGDMRVSFETQRQLKSREALAETLDIRIVDGAGERPYENFSGGEQFRVNFAIRLALSQVLAKRAGARLQTLVIDEGFGSQDPNGRQRLVEAINTIQDDFARILVITHIDELRDAFPARIEVEKRATGSVISIV